MKSVTRIAAAAALSIASITLAQAKDADADARQVVALADTRAVSGSIADVPLESYAGRYVAADGRTFSITVDDDGLVLESLESSGISLLTLHAVDGRNFAAIAAGVRVTFSFDANGEVSGASVYRADALQAVATTRTPLRGVVTIIDSVDEAAGHLRHGIVTIIDVPSVAEGGVAAAN